MKTKTPKNSTRFRFALLCVTAALVSIASTGCQTIRGAGRDVEHTGEHLQRATGH